MKKTSLMIFFVLIIAAGVRLLTIIVIARFRTGMGPD